MSIIVIIVIVVGVSIIAAAAAAIAIFFFTDFCTVCNTIDVSLVCTGLVFALIAEAESYSLVLRQRMRSSTGSHPLGNMTMRVILIAFKRQ